MTDGEQQIIQLLTEMRDAQKQTFEAHKQALEYNRKASEEALAFHRRAAQAQRGWGWFLLVFFIVIGVVVWYFLFSVVSPTRSRTPFPQSQGDNRAF